MSYEYNKNLVPNAQKLRKNMTKEEKHIWYDFFKKLPVTVHRQKNIGEYIVDFYIPEKKAVIEIDGKQHRMPEIPEQLLISNSPTTTVKNTIFFIIAAKI